MTKQEILDEFGIPVTYLNPSKLDSSNTKSKMGGDESFILNNIDKCQYCNHKMTLIIELFKEEYSDAYFPNESNYMQVKTCYHQECTFDENRDIKFFIGFGHTSKLKPNHETIESFIPAVYFNPITNLEIPYNTYETEYHLKTIKEIGQEAYENMIEDHVAMIGTKINGDIFSWNTINIPVCSCGNKMKQILQISSYEPCLHPNEDRKYYNWDSSIGVQIARIGNYHYFICGSCKNAKIEYRYDSL